MQKLDFIQLIEQRLATLEARLTQLVDHRLTEEVKKTISIARIDLPFSLAKARYVLELVIRDIYQRELPQEKPKPLFDQLNEIELLHASYSTAVLIALFQRVRLWTGRRLGWRFPGTNPVALQPAHSDNQGGGQAQIDCHL